MHDRQDSLFSGIINRALDNIVGSVFDFVPSTGDPELDKVAKSFITKRMTKKVCDASGQFDFSSLLKIALRGVWNDGASVLTQRKNGSMLAFEADQLESPNQVGQNGSARRIVNGIELNKLNRHIAYWIRQRETRGDFGAGIHAASNSKRISSSRVFYPAYKTRIGQTSGVPFLASILKRHNKINNYLDYESVAAEINAMLAWQIKRSDTGVPTPGNEANTDTASTYDRVEKIEPGMLFDLDPGESVEMVGSQRPGDNFEPYLINCLRIIGVGIGMPLELIMLDFSRTNYSSARASLGEARRMFRVWQKFAGTEICLPWHTWQITRGIALGELPARPELFNTRIQWPAWEYIEPVKEATGNRISMEDNVKSPSEVIRERGAEPIEVFQEIADDKAKMQELGIFVEPRQTDNQFSSQVGMLMSAVSDLTELVEDMKND
jgi:lambda family phage portal protein